MDVKQLTELAALDLTNLIQSENNVKYRIVIPFLQSFDHQHIDLEHAAQGSRIDINIGNKIVVETKALSQYLDNHVQQLSDYCGREWPVLAILTNGRNFRIYSPQWRRQATFREKIIYAFDIKDLANVKLLNRLEKILGLSSYQSEEFLDYIDQREKELLEVGRKIDDLRQIQSGEISQIRTDLIGLKEQVRELNKEIQLKEQAVSEIGSQGIPEINSLVSEFFVPRITPTPDIQVSRTVEPRSINEGNGRTKFPNGCIVDGIHYANGSKAIRGLLSAGIIEKSDLPTSSYNAHLWLREKHSKFGFRYERDEN
ncbi:MAG: hypothetical protein NTV58_08070 [Deltaproteobacteria bacterium]|nr:hypothetical protein [Deltaproteobacteria bacterium]